MTKDEIQAILNELAPVYWAMAGIALHVGGHFVLSLLKKEDGYE